MAKDIRKSVRITVEQDAELKKKVKDAGMTESEFLRLMIDGRPKDYPDIRSELNRLTNEVHQIGVNINEIVYNNNTMLYKESDKRHLLAYVQKINEALKRRVNDIGDNKNSVYR